MVEKDLPTPFELKQKIPLPKSASCYLQNFKEVGKKRLQNPFDKNLFLFVGPCSLHEKQPALLFGKKLKELSLQLKNITLIMRAYIEKPRTVSGYKGALYQPSIFEDEDLEKGLFFSRGLLTELALLNLPLAMEFVDPYLFPYFSDLISWGFVGARTVSSQTHRQLASSLDFPVGFKNSLDGNIEAAVHSMVASLQAHSYFAISDNGRLIAKNSTGNPFTHLTLRGSYKDTNYDKASLEQSYTLLKNHDLSTPILVDCSHGNSKKDLGKQKEIFLETLELFQEENLPLLGMMLESYLEEGSQALCKKGYNPQISVTDPCLGFKETAALLLYADELLSSKKTAGSIC